MKVKCPICNNEIEEKFDTEKKEPYFYCQKCKKGGRGKTAEIAKTEFIKKCSEVKPTTAPIETPQVVTVKNVSLTIPKKPAELTKWSDDNIQVLSERSAQFMERPAVQRMIQKNTRYAMTADFKKAWNTPEGQESIINALQESFEIGATLPEMGSIVPFGAVVELIAALPAYEHALTTGKNPPYKNIRINCLYEKDIYDMSRTDGIFHFEITKMGFPRGDVIGVIVQAFDISAGHDIGEAYDVQALMLKAEKHSAGYQYYLKDMTALRKAEAEQKDYIIKWEKKVYEKDITSPYVGADRSKMLEKLAGKSFFAKDMKVRNARAMETERVESEPLDPHDKKVTDTILDHAVEQVKIIDAEYKEE